MPLGRCAPLTPTGPWNRSSRHCVATATVLKGARTSRRTRASSSSLVSLSCDCKALRRLELFGSVLADGQQDLDLRWKAAVSLMTVDDPRAVDVLAAATSDPDPAVRRAARLALKVARRRSGR